MANKHPFHVDPRAVADEGKEIDIQSRFRKLLQKIAPSVAFVAIPNGAKRSAWEAIQAKREGLSSGFPDVICLWAGGCAYLEFKTRGGVLSDQQVSWLTWMVENGHACGVFRSVSTAEQFLRSLGAPFIGEARNAA